MYLGLKRAAGFVWAAMIVWALANLAGAQQPDKPKPAGGAAPAAAPAGPPAELGAIAGKWVTALEGLPGGPQLGELVAEKSGDKMTAVVKSSLGEMKVDNVTVSGENHVLNFFIEAMGQSMDVQATIKIAGDQFTGKLLVGGGMLEAGFKGAKAGSEHEKELKKYVEDKIKEVVGEPVLPVADAKDFMGAWTFSGESPMGGSMEVEFELLDVGGKASGKLKLPPPLGTHTINKMAKSDKGLTMTYQMELMNNPMEMKVDMERQGPMISGLIDVGGGMFQIPLEGAKKGRGITKLTTAGKNVLIEYGRPSTSGPGYQKMNSTLKDGLIWRMGKDEATNLKTDADLKFGDKTIKAGRYSLWAKRVGNGWNLVFNSKPDVWGTAHDAKADVAEVPLTSGKIEKPAELLTLELKQGEPGSGTFRLAWGGEEGTTKFSVVGAEAPAGGATGAAPAGGAKPAGGTGAGAKAPAAPKKSS